MKNITPIQWIIFGFMSILLAVTPFVVSSSLLFPFITGKNFLFRIIIEICLGLWVFDCLKNKESRPKRSMVAFSIIAFVSVLGLADLLGVDPYRSFWSNYERMEGWITLLHLLAFFYIVASSLTEKLWYRLIQISLATSFIVGVQALFELKNIDRVDGSFGNSTYLGAYAMFHVFFSLMFILRHFYEQKRNDVFMLNISIYSFLALFNSVILYFTGTRSALLGLVGGLSVVACIYIFTEREHKGLRNISIGIVGLIIVTVGVLASIRGTDFAKRNPLIDRFSSLATLDIKNYAENAGNARFMVWSIALEGVKERPVLGWGQDNFPKVFSKYYVPGMFEQEQWFDRCHNVFFDWLIAGGVLGLLAYLSMFVSVLSMVWSKKSSVSSVEKGIITGIIVAYFIHNIFVFDNITSYILIFLLLAFVHLKDAKEVRFLSGKVSDNSQYMIASLIILVLGYAMYTLNYPGFRASQDIINALSYSQVALSSDSKIDVKDKEAYMVQSYGYFKSSINRNTFGTRESGEQLSDVTSQVYKGNFSNDLKNSFEEIADTRLRAEATRLPLDTRANLFYGIYLLNIGKKNEAVNFLEKAHELSPKKQTILFSLSEAYSYLGNEASSTDALRMAYELDKSFARPAIFYATNLIDNGDQIQASRIIKSISDEKLLDVNNIQFLVKIKRFDLVIQIFKNLLLNDPNKPQLKISLAAAYLQNGQRDLAIQTIEEVATSLPQFKQQANYLISEIRAGRNPIDK